MKKRLIIIASLIFVFACIFAVTVSAKCAECDTEIVTQTGSNGFLDQVTITEVCPTCGYVTSSETIPALFITKGYSYSEDGSISQRYAVNREAVERYEAVTGEKVDFGVVTATRNHVASAPINPDGTPLNDKVISADFTNTKYDLFDVIVRNVPAEYQASTGIICSAYVIIDGVVSYIDNGVKKSADSAYTYEEVKVIVDNGLVETTTTEKQEWNDDGALKILTIGNSYSDDETEYVYNVAKSLGFENVQVANLRANSCSLATHLANAKNDTGYYMFRYWGNGADRWTDYGSWSSNGTYKISTAVAQGDWDYIIFQQVSTSSYDAASYDDLNELIAIVEEINPTAKLGWHMTWSDKFTSSEDTMYNGIVNAVQTKIVTNDKIDVIIPVGTTIQNARTTTVFDPVELMRNASNKHLNYGLGRYAAALTVVKALTGVSIDNISYMPTADTEGHTFNYDDSYKAAIIEAVNNAVENPFKVTKANYADPEKSIVGKVALDNELLNLTKNSFYNKNAGEYYFEPLSPEKLPSAGIVYDYGRYFATKMFTKEMLPVGSVIEVNGGYKYFVEGWELDENGTPIAGEGAFNSRFSATGTANSSDASAFVGTYRVVVTENWWGDNDIVAFNIGVPTQALSGVNVEDVANLFKIYVTEEAVAKNQEGAKDASGNLYDPTPYDKPAYAPKDSVVVEGGVSRDSIDWNASVVIDGKTYYALSFEELEYQCGFYNCTDNTQISNSNAGWNAKYTAMRLMTQEDTLNGFVIWTKKNMKTGNWMTEGEFYSERGGEYVVKDTVNGDYIEIDESFWTKLLASDGFTQDPNPEKFPEGEDFDVRGLYFYHDGVNALDTAFDNFRIYVPASMIAAE